MTTPSSEEQYMNEMRENLGHAIGYLEDAMNVVERNKESVAHPSKQMDKGRHVLRESR